MKEVGWYGYFCNYCDLFTWMGQYEDDEAQKVKCRKCGYDVRRHTKWITHNDFLTYRKIDCTLQELRRMGLYE